ncbi:hypothetical protein [Streptomyces aurantiogriseus]|uniref:Uncharacterized protein n=1 Tax=Streptomyces aurantiogriseus TaxID=66870 RepID=A0A918FM79_9ACTN|nr:hypothetical protein [Streptomyces aurantiogriseus]GGR48467.1 hypothetical protein GCM10010251_76780 [Streptomyces aurantiogriseus]
MTYHPEQRRPRVIVCHDEASDFLPFADLQDRFRADPVSLADLHRVLADMRARFTNLARPEDS